MIYYLVGMMGSGKTHLGKQLAERLKVPFLDLDQCIKADEERSISDIFEKEGEGHFREIEAQRLRVIADDYEAVVVATGGGKGRVQRGDVDRTLCAGEREAIHAQERRGWCIG